MDFSKVKKIGNSHILQIMLAILLAICTLSFTALIAIDASVFSPSLFLDVNSGRNISDPAGISSEDYQTYYTAFIRYFQSGDETHLEKTVNRNDYEVSLFSPSETEFLAGVYSGYAFLATVRRVMIAAAILIIILSLVIFTKQQLKRFLGIAAITASSLLLLGVLMGMICGITESQFVKQVLDLQILEQNGLLYALWPNSALQRFAEAWVIMALLLSIIPTAVFAAVSLRIGKKKTFENDDYMYQS